uniref:Uncharacterized protein n=1 Tax=Romanomermis culicivorax TaxID=13658 RepID=A0A915ISV2_ROMCU
MVVETTTTSLAHTGRVKLANVARYSVRQIKLVGVTVEIFVLLVRYLRVKILITVAKWWFCIRQLFFLAFHFGNAGVHSRTYKNRILKGAAFSLLFLEYNCLSSATPNDEHEARTPPRTTAPASHCLCINCSTSVTETRLCADRFLILATLVFGSRKAAGKLSTDLEAAIVLDNCVTYIYFVASGQTPTLNEFPKNSQKKIFLLWVNYCVKESTIDIDLQVGWLEIFAINPVKYVYMSISSIQIKN